MNERYEILEAMRAETLQSGDERAEERVKELERRLADVTERNRRLHAELESIYSSVGWRLLERAYRLRRSPVVNNRVMAPVLRLARGMVQAYADGGVREILRRSMKKLSPPRPTPVESQSSVWERLRASLQPVSCDLCGSDNAAILLPQKPAPIARCSSCGLIYYNPQPTEEALREYYSSEDKDAYTPKLREWQGELDARKERVLTDELNLLEQSLLRNGSIQNGSGQAIRFLEVGCAFGHQLYCARRKGWDVVGIELSQPAVEWVKAELGLEVVLGTIEEAAAVLPEASFDLILMSHVLEHVRRPTSTVQAVFRLLKPGGVVAIYVPNGEGIQARVDFNAWEWTFLAHLYYFSPRTLARLLTRCGFEVESIWTCVGHSTRQKLLGLIQQRLCLDSLEQAEQVAELLGPMGLLSDLRVVARKPTRT